MTTLVSTYTGSWVNGAQTGYGTQTFENAIYPGLMVQYEGGFLNGLFHGDGAAAYMISPSPIGYDYQVSYSGGWNIGKWSGGGTIRYASGTQYDGGVHMGMKHGYGVMTFPNGSRYEGGWKMDHEEGYCVEIDVNGQRYESAIHGDNNISGYEHKNWIDESSYDGGW